MFELHCLEKWQVRLSRQAAGVGAFRFVLVLFSLRLLSNTPSVRLHRHKAKDGDVLMHACQKITAQLFSAKSYTGMAGEKLNETPKLCRRTRGWWRIENQSVTVCSIQSCLRHVKNKNFARSLNWNLTAEVGFVKLNKNVGGNLGKIIWKRKHNEYNFPKYMLKKQWESMYCQLLAKNWDSVTMKTSSLSLSTRKTWSTSMCTWLIMEIRICLFSLTLWSNNLAADWFSAGAS